MAKEQVELKRVLGFRELMAQAVGNIIGAGVMTLLGSAIALTGRSLPLSFLVATFIVVGYALPWSWNVWFITGFLLYELFWLWKPESDRFDRSYDLLFIKCIWN